MKETQKSNFEPEIEVYKLYKAEIEREDTVAYHRSISSLTFQGFLFASATFLVSNPWFATPAVDIYPFRKFVLVLQGFTGFVTGLLTAVGVMAAASLIASVVAAYEKLNWTNTGWPQLHGGPRQALLGANFPMVLHFALAALWAVYEVVLIDQLSADAAIVACSAIGFFLLTVATFLLARRYLTKAPVDVSNAGLTQNA